MYVGPRRAAMPCGSGGTIGTRIVNKTVKPIKYKTLMKEKIKKMLQYICTWKFVMWLNIVFATFHLVMCFIDLHAAYAGGVVWHLGYALVSYYLQKYEERHWEDRLCIVTLNYHFAECLTQLNRYKTRYGELPPDEPQAEAPQEETSQAEAQETKESETEIPQADAPSAVSRKPRAVNRKPRAAKPSPTAKADAPSVEVEKPKRPAINPGKPHRTSSGAPRKPRTQKNKEEL